MVYACTSQAQVSSRALGILLSILLEPSTSGSGWTDCVAKWKPVLQTAVWNICEAPPSADKTK